MDLIFHKNSTMPSNSAAKHPKTKTTNTPPTFDIPNSAALSEELATSAVHVPYTNLKHFQS